MNSNTIISLDKLSPPPLTNPFIVPPSYILSFLSPKQIEVVLDILHLNSKTDHSFESWPIEPLAPQPQLAGANKKFKSAINLMYAYAHAPLDEETIFSPVSPLEVNYMLSFEAFMVLKDSQNFSPNKCTHFSKNSLI